MSAEESPARPRKKMGLRGAAAPRKVPDPPRRVLLATAAVRVAISKSRNAPKMIARWAKAKNFHAIVVPDPERPRWRRTIEGDLAREIERRSGIPVHAVSVPSTSRRSHRAS